MSHHNEVQKDKPSAAQVAEAAAWIAHLHGSKRTAASDRGLQLWLKGDAARARMWEAATEVWNEVGNLQGAAIEQALKINDGAWRVRRLLSASAAPAAKILAMAATLLIIAVTALLFLLRDSSVETGVGEQRILALEDGSRIVLNTATRLVVNYNGQERRVKLKSGEALFEVAKHSQRPFVVEAGNQTIRALGTAFLVRRDTHRLAVTLVEGKVAVSPLDSRHNVQTPGTSDAGTVLIPGQRLTFAGDRLAKLDRPELKKITAWQQGQVVLDGVRLQDAIAEMNRYSNAELSVERPHAADLLISGVFRSGDSLSFARAVAATYRLKVVQKDEGIVIAGDPEAAYH